VARPLVDIRGSRRRAVVGGKAAALNRLVRLGFNVPPTWVVPHRRIPSSARDAAALRDALSASLDPKLDYAVRSSAVVEDDETRSFAGRFLTRLDVPARAVAEAIFEVAGQATEGPAEQYAEALGDDSSDLRVAVIVQQMVHAIAAGVVFSRNPVTGVKETVIEAGSGTAENLVAGRTRPERWVYRHGEWLLTPQDPVLTAEAAREIAEGAQRLEAKWGRPIDAEWAWDGKLWWLQVRPITVGADAAVYSSRMARDMLPGLIKPLVWSVNGPVMGDAHVRLLEQVFGPLRIDPADLATLFHYRVYINVGALSRLAAEFGLPEDSLEMLAGMQPGASMPRMPHPTPRVIRRAPRMARSALHFSRFDRVLHERMPDMWERSHAFEAGPRADGLSPSELLDRATELQDLVQDVAYHHMATLMLMQMFTMRARARVRRAGVEPDDAPDLFLTSASERYNLGLALAELSDVARRQTAEVQDLIAAQDVVALRASGAAAEFVAAFDAFEREFGHFSDSGVNFSAPPWSEQPGRMLGMVAGYMASETSPRAVEPCDALAGRGRAGRSAQRACARAATFQSLRDETSSLYVRAYGQFRPIMLALGRSLEREGALECVDDVFYLTREEIGRFIGGQLDAAEARAIVSQRTEEMVVAGRGEPPEVVVGAVAELIEMPGRQRLRGISASRGRYTGRVVVCQGLGDLERIQAGDVVVVPYSDASWLPLFTRAGAIVAESGGMLSHSAILARELGLPAIVAVRGALSLPEGALVSIDCYDSTVTVLPEAS
jgi:phosphohistidine swiveling domain-containing protein